jgi:hypothetical protein
MCLIAQFAASAARGLIAAILFSVREFHVNNAGESLTSSRCSSPRPGFKPQRARSRTLDAVCTH